MGGGIGGLFAQFGSAKLSPKCPSAREEPFPERLLAKVRIEVRSFESTGASVGGLFFSILRRIECSGPFLRSRRRPRPGEVLRLDLRTHKLNTVLV